MGEDQLVAVQQICASYNVETTFISTLSQHGLIDVIKIGDNEYIEPDQLTQLEKFVRFHYELDINLEGIETINYLLERLRNMQEEVTALRNRLKLYEPL